MTQARRSSADWQKDFVHGIRELADPHEAAGRILALAFPDRIGRARGGSGRYLLANGRGAHFGEPQALSKSEFIVAAELDGAEREARIYLAAPLQLCDIEQLFEKHIEERSQVAWDEREQAIRRAKSGVCGRCCWSREKYGIRTRRSGPRPRWPV